MSAESRPAAAPVPTERPRASKNDDMIASVRIAAGVAGVVGTASRAGMSDPVGTATSSEAASGAIDRRAR